ncbi:MAG: FGGY family carbohydrate kinase [Coxiellaceae bacterium]|nr:FGGY family carbohydrate kinase [Coxiellaceae bacterium]
MIFLLIDFGASHTKVGLTNLETMEIYRVKVYESLKNCSDKPGHYEIAPFELTIQFQKILEDYDQLFEAVVICSQMHGFLLVDEAPLTNYIGWQDERCLEEIEGISTFEIIQKKFSESFRKITGMKLKPGLPVLNVLHVLRSKKIQNSSCKMLSLPEWVIASVCDTVFDVTHATIQAGLGFYDINTQKIASDIIDFIEDETKIKIKFNQTSDIIKVAGHIKNIPVYVGVGDLQCALLGAGINKEAISINLGTGSQVSIIINKSDEKQFEVRPFFENQYLLTQTHIPSGRALNEYVNFIADIGKVCFGQTINPWDLLKNISKEDILHSTLDFNLNIFKSAYQYSDGGYIKLIQEGTLNTKNYFASLLRNYIMQYVSLAAEMQINREISHTIFSGGIAKKLPVISELIQILSQKKVVLLENNYDETLLGLQKIASWVV